MKFLMPSFTSLSSLFFIISIIVVAFLVVLTWNIIGQVKNVGTTTQNGLQVTADFYDSSGNNVGGNKTLTVSPSNLNSQQTGTFIITARIADMKGTASFVRLEYESNQ